MGKEFKDGFIRGEVEIDAGPLMYPGQESIDGEVEIDAGPVMYPGQQSIDGEVEIDAGPLMYPGQESIDGEVEIDAGPEMQTLMGDDEETAKAMLALAGTGVAAYGLYRLFSGSSNKPAGAAKSSPWLYKLNPLYWFKDSTERRYIDIEKNRGQRNVELEKELAAAQRAYNTSQAAAAKEGQISAIESQLKAHGAVSGESTMHTQTHRGTEDPTVMSTIDSTEDPTTFPMSGDVPHVHRGTEDSTEMSTVDSTEDSTEFRMTGIGNDFVGKDMPGWNSAVDKKALAALRAGKIPLAAGSVLSREQSEKMATLLTKTFGGDREKAGKWLLGLLERQQISWKGPDGAVYAYRGGRKFLAAPPMPPEIKKAAMKGASLMGAAVKAQKRKHATDKAVTIVDALIRKNGIGTEIEVAGEKFYLIGPAHAKKVRTAAFQEAAIKTFGGNKAMAQKAFAKWAEKKHAIVTVTPKKSYVYAKGKKVEVRGTPGEGLYPAAKKVWNIGATFVGVDFVGATPTLPTKQSLTSQQRFISVASKVQAPKISMLAAQMGLTGKKSWTAAERDQIAKVLMSDLMKMTGKPPNAGDAYISRQIVKVYGGGRGVQVAGDEESIIAGTDVIGIDWWKLNPVYGTYWLGKQAVKGAAAVARGVGRGVMATGRYVGRKLGIVKRPQSPAQQMAAQQAQRDARHRMALESAARARAAAAARIKAAEKRHEAAIAEREEQRRIADAEAEAQEALAAAREAEAIAIEAEAMQDVPGDAWAIEGWETLEGVSVPIGPMAKLAASDTFAGRQVRLGAEAARAVKTQPGARAQLKQTVDKAKNGDPHAKKALRQMRAGKKADDEKKDALSRDVAHKRNLAEKAWGYLKKMVKTGYGIGVPALSGDEISGRGGRRGGGRGGRRVGAAGGRRASGANKRHGQWGKRAMGGRKASPQARAEWLAKLSPEKRAMIEKKMAERKASRVAKLQARLAKMQSGVPAMSGDEVGFGFGLASLPLIKTHTQPAWVKDLATGIANQIKNPKLISVTPHA